MSGSPEDNHSIASAPERGWRLSKDTLNLVIAVCAVLISAASFVASYMQSEAAFRQVKAETWPYLQLDSGNVDSVTGDRIITVKLENVGVGPADVKSFELYYKDEHVKTVYQFIPMCCAAASDMRMPALTAAGFITSTPAPKILASGAASLVFALPETTENAALWAVLDKARFDLRARGCYCSLLGECYETDFVSAPIGVEACRVNPKLNYSG
ncbi:hypothetical protein [Kordiimonas sp.]|uniref:hypothetical protein n=1 Tax=Kordiimonas sp. TaxID=1970157 RepID=UPI003A92DDBC